MEPTWGNFKGISQFEFAPSLYGGETNDAIARLLRSILRKINFLTGKAFSSVVFTAILSMRIILTKIFILNSYQWLEYPFCRS